MRAVNLVPKDLRSAGARGGSGSPVGVYGLLAVLAVLVALVGLWAHAGRQVKDREAEAAQLNAEAQAAEAQAADLSGFEAIVAAAEQRRTAVVGSIESRVPWAETLEEISRTVPKGVSIDSMKATTSAAVTVEGGTSDPLRGSVDAPAVEMAGCAPSQGDVARLMSRLRSMKDVSKVSVSSSTKTAGDEGASGDTGATDCTGGSPERPQFSMVVFLTKPAGAASATTPATGDTTAAATTTTTGSGQ